MRRRHLQIIINDQTPFILGLFKLKCKGTLLLTTFLHWKSLTILCISRGTPVYKGHFLQSFIHLESQLEPSGNPRSSVLFNMDLGTLHLSSVLL